MRHARHVMSIKSRNKSLNVEDAVAWQTILATSCHAILINRPGLNLEDDMAWQIMLDVIHHEHQPCTPSSFLALTCCKRASRERRAPPHHAPGPGRWSGSWTSPWRTASRSLWCRAACVRPPSQPAARPPAPPWSPTMSLWRGPETLTPLIPSPKPCIPRGPARGVRGLPTPSIPFPDSRLNRLSVCP